ncbi:MAG: efflux RND transporter periplasmic adaptor subunit, partial [Calditrichales bacterium]
MDRQIEKKNWPPKKLITYIAAAAFIAVILYMLIFGDSSSRLKVTQDKITISTVVKGPFKEYIPVTGTVIPIKTVYLDAIEGGQVEKRFLEAGSMVSAGDEILMISNTNLLMDIMFREA